MSKKLTPEEHEAKIAEAAKKKARAKYKARTHQGQGVITDYYAGQKGNWVTIQPKEGKPVTVRPSQVTLY